MQTGFDKILTKRNRKLHIERHEKSCRTAVFRLLNHLTATAKTSSGLIRLAERAVQNCHKGFIDRHKRLFRLSEEAFPHAEKAPFETSEDLK